MQPLPLIAAGLTKLQAQAYILLLEKGTLTPPEAARQLRLTRTNAYKLLDKLVALRLASLQGENKKRTYVPSSPLSLAALASDYRAKAVAREEAVNSVLGSLLTSFYKHSEQPIVAVASGQEAVIKAYQEQINQNEDIYFVHSRADVPLMGFEAMHQVRMEPARRQKQRHGILQRTSEGPINHQSHQRSNLNITWMRPEDYKAPVEWSATRSSLLIVLFGADPHAVTITNPVIAGAFLQLWQLLDSCLRAMPDYSKLSSSN